MGGGGGGGAPTQQTITQTNIPDWLRPQVETVLGGAMQQLFQTKETPGTYNRETGQTGPSTYEITGVNPFKPFQTSQEQLDIASGAVAGLSPLQQQAMQGAANLRLPGQFGVGTNMAGQAGLGGLFAGSQYANMATDPNSIQSYMSPYMQNVVNVQQQQAQRQADIDRQTMQAQAARAGAFGGGRFGIQQSQSAAELARQKQNIQATGLQNAFQQAQQAQQFGANLGLQGLQLAGAQAANLGQLGTAQLAAERGILEEQTKAGALEQQQQQNIINQAIQNYAQAQQYPLQQYNAYNALLRGYSIPGQTATTYQAAPSLANQLTGLGTAAYGASKAFGAKEGGTVKMATGGIASINEKVLTDPYEFSPEQIKQGIESGSVSDLIGIPALDQLERFRRQAQAIEAIQQPPIAQQLMEAADRGLDSLTSNLPSDGYAGGGIVSFDGGGRVERFQAGGSGVVAPKYQASAFSDQQILDAARKEGFFNFVEKLLGPKPGLRSSDIGSYMKAQDDLNKRLSELRNQRPVASSLAASSLASATTAPEAAARSTSSQADVRRADQKIAEQASSKDKSSENKNKKADDTPRADYSLASSSYSPWPMPIEEKYTPEPMDSILAKVEEARKRQLGEETKANQPIYREFEESLGKQGKRLEGADERNKAMALIAMGLRTAQSTGPLGSAIAAGGIEGLTAYMRGDAANRAAEEKMEEARRSFSLQRLSLEKGDRRAAEQYAQDVRKALIDADRFNQTAAIERNKIALEKYRIGEGARSDAAKLRLQERLGIEGLNVRRQQLGVQAGRDFARMASIMQDAREQAAKEVKDELARNPTVAINLKKDEQERMIEERANRIASKILARSISNLRTEDDGP